MSQMNKFQSGTFYREFNFNILLLNNLRGNKGSQQLTAIAEGVVRYVIRRRHRVLRLRLSGRNAQLEIL